MRPGTLIMSGMNPTQTVRPYPLPAIVFEFLPKCHPVSTKFLKRGGTEPCP
jgi:hypothetical protein